MTSGRLYLDDLHVGQRFVSDPHRLDAEQIKAFAAEFDPQPFHLDEEAAKKSLFGGLAASGWHTAALSMRMLVESVPLADGLIGAELQLAWPRPTRLMPESRSSSRMESRMRATNFFIA